MWPRKMPPYSLEVGQLLVLDVKLLGGVRQMLENYNIVGTTLPYFSVLDSLDLCLGLFKNAYTYLPAPPPVPTAAVLTSSIAKEWGTHSPESEKFCTADLNPFESALFCSLRSHSPVGGNATVPRGGRDRRWSLGSSSPSRPPTKRAKVEVDTGPLDELIPLVHR